MKIEVLIVQNTRICSSQKLVFNELICNDHASPLQITIILTLEYCIHYS